VLSLSCCLESPCAGVGCNCPVLGPLLSYEVVLPSPHAATGAVTPLLPLLLSATNLLGCHISPRLPLELSYAVAGTLLGCCPCAAVFTVFRA
jgi:hypothetical protein